MKIEFELYKFQGGVPPHRGFHFSSNETLKAPKSSTWKSLCTSLKNQIDESNLFDISIRLYEKSSDKETVIYEEDPGFSEASGLTDKSPVEVFADKKITLRVYQPFQRGMTDIGVYVPINTEMESASPLEAFRVSLKDKEEFTINEIQELKQRLLRSNPQVVENSTSEGFKVLEPISNLQETAFLALKAFADKVFSERSNNNTEISSLLDLQIPIKRDQLLEVIGESALKEMDERYGQTCADIVLRRSSYLGHCIDFHVDYAYKTMQISVNNDDEYEGGRLVFAGKDDKLHIPVRRRGTITIHEGKTVHGVTALKSGVRYGLLVLDRPTTTI